MTDFAPLLPWLFGLGVVAVLVGGFLLDRKRRERIMTFCLARGWSTSTRTRRCGSVVGRAVRPRRPSSGAQRDPRQ